MNRPPCILVCVAVLCLLVPACVITEGTLSDADKAQPDHALLGAWLQRGDDGSHLVVVGRHPYGPDDQPNETVPAGILSYQVVSVGNDGELTPQQEPAPLFFVSTVGMEGYLNVFDRKAPKVDNKGAWKLPPNTHSWIMKYRIDGNTLRLWQLDTEKVRAAIAKGVVKGEVRQRRFIQETAIRDAAGLVEYLRKEGSVTLFADDPAVTLTRVPMPPM